MAMDDTAIVVYVVNRDFNHTCPKDMTLQFAVKDCWSGLVGTVEYPYKPIEDLIGQGTTSTGCTFPQEVAPALCNIVKLGGEKSGSRRLGHFPWYRMEMTLGELRAIMEAEHERRKLCDDQVG